jgi:hypothetical protein
LFGWLVTGGWCLICCERKILLASKWLTGADLMLEKSTAGWLADIYNMKG